ncbi:MAG: DUF488 domain-containing protein [Coriobacteriales bacterium]|jgi:hypothetical protein|nr:DUF488 domain-containing protein [Coriobacteriales bacterium]
MNRINKQPTVAGRQAIDRQPTYKRQRFLLAFIRQLNDDITATDLQLLVLLHTMATDSNFYEFVACKQGAYSFQLAADLDILHNSGYVSIDHSSKHAQIKAVKGHTGNEHAQIKAVKSYTPEHILQIATERGDALLRKAYCEYPYYAINSTTVEQMFCKEELQQFNEVKRTYIKSGQVLFTLGYEGRSVEAFINALLHNNVKVLCDVRKNPLSRKFGFSKGKLRHIAQNAGIEYVHIPGLGIESGKRSSLDTPEDYQRLFSEYAETLPSLGALLEQVYVLLSLNDRIALMCYEREPERCHRHVIRDFLTDTYQIQSVDL